MVGSEDDRESTFSGHAGRVLASAPLPLFGIALFGALGPFTELWKRSAYRSVPSEIYFTLPPVLDALQIR